MYWTWPLAVSLSWCEAGPRGGKAPVQPAVGFSSLALGSPSVGEQLVLLTVQNLLTDQPSSGLWSFHSTNPSLTTGLLINSLPAYWGSSGTAQNLCPAQTFLASGFQAPPQWFSRYWCPDHVWGHDLMRDEAVVMALQALAGLMTLSSITCGFHSHRGALSELCTLLEERWFLAQWQLFGCGIPWCWLQPVGWYLSFVQVLGTHMLSTGPDLNSDLWVGFLAWCWTCLLALILPYNLDPCLVLAALFCICFAWLQNGDWVLRSWPAILSPLTLDSEPLREYLAFAAPNKEWASCGINKILRGKELYFDGRVGVGWVEAELSSAVFVLMSMSTGIFTLGDNMLWDGCVFLLLIWRSSWGSVISVPFSSYWQRT